MKQTVKLSGPVDMDAAFKVIKSTLLKKRIDFSYLHLTKVSKPRGKYHYEYNFTIESAPKPKNQTLKIHKG